MSWAEVASIERVEGSAELRGHETGTLRIDRGRAGGSQTLSSVRVRVREEQERSGQVRCHA